MVLFCSVLLVPKRKCQTASIITEVSLLLSGFGGLVVSMLAPGTQDHWFEPGRRRRIFRAKKSSECLRSEGK
jgi:hypothetical protein